jgi:hypothetical protein
MVIGFVYTVIKITFSSASSIEIYTERGSKIEVYGSLILNCQRVRNFYSGFGENITLSSSPVRKLVISILTGTFYHSDFIM